MNPDEQLAIRIAAMMGDSSAAAQALEELRARRAAGEAANIAHDGNFWLVYSDQLKNP